MPPNLALPSVGCTRLHIALVSQDDTEAIRAAMFAGRRCGEKCNGSTTKNAIVYFPPGKYLVSGTIPVIFGTQLIGDVGAPSPTPF